MRRTIVICAGLALVVATVTSCADDSAGDGAAVDGSAGSAQADALAARSGLESDAVVDALCDGWATDHPDQPTINEYVHDLLDPLERVNSGDPPAYTTEDIDALVVAACREERDDPAAFLDVVRDGLGLSEADLDELVLAACDRYREQQERFAEGDWSGEDIAKIVRDLAADHDVNLEALRAAVAGICATPPPA